MKPRKRRTIRTAAETKRLEKEVWKFFRIQRSGNATLQEISDKFEISKNKASVIISKYMGNDRA